MIPPSAVDITTVRSLITHHRLRVLVLQVYPKYVARATRPLTSLSKTASSDAQQNIQSEREWEKAHFCFFNFFGAPPFAGTRFLFRFLSTAVCIIHQTKGKENIK
jgi:hypothetical protein